MTEDELVAELLPVLRRYSADYDAGSDGLQDFQIAAAMGTALSKHLMDAWDYVPPEESP